MVHSIAAAGSALALSTVNSPFGPSAPVQALIGRNTQAPVEVIVWKRVSDGACKSTLIGDAFGLTDDVLVVGSSGADTIIVEERAPDYDAIFCNFHLNTLDYGGHFLDVHGGAGDDTLLSGSGDTWHYGEDGNDYLAFKGAGNLFGGNGNDIVIAMSSIFTAEGLYGEAGSDCLEDQNNAAFTIDCGPGSDQISLAYGIPIRVNCESFAVIGCFR